MPETTEDRTSQEQQASNPPAGEKPTSGSGSPDTPGSPSSSRSRLVEERGVGSSEPSPESKSSEEGPPLPSGPPPADAHPEEDDGWQPVWEETYGAFYFYNSITGETTWTNPRVPEAPTNGGGPSKTSATPDASAPDPLQYNPAIHGDYDPTAPYAQPREDPADYSSKAAFNRFTGKFTPANSHHTPENYNDENKSRRQMEFYFDVDAAANSHDGRSLKAERQTKRLTKKELKEYKEKRKQRKEEKRKAWLKD